MNRGILYWIYYLWFFLSFNVYPLNPELITLFGCNLLWGQGFWSCSSLYLYQPLKNTWHLIGTPEISMLKVQSRIRHYFRLFMCVYCILDNTYNFQNLKTVILWKVHRCPLVSYSPGIIFVSTFYFEVLWSILCTSISSSDNTILWVMWWGLH